MRILIELFTFKRTSILVKKNKFLGLSFMRQIKSINLIFKINTLTTKFLKKEL